MLVQGIGLLDDGARVARILAEPVEVTGSAKGGCQGQGRPMYRALRERVVVIAISLQG